MPFQNNTQYLFYVTAWNAVPAVYGVVDRAGTVIYVGQTDDLKRRMGEHLADKNHLMHSHAPWSVVVEVNSDGEFVRRLREAQLIAEYNPAANRTIPTPLISPALMHRFRGQ